MKNIFQILKIRHLAKKCRKCVGRFAHVLDYDDDILSSISWNGDTITKIGYSRYLNKFEKPGDYYIPISDFIEAYGYTDWQGYYAEDEEDGENKGLISSFVQADISTLLLYKSYGSPFVARELVYLLHLQRLRLFGEQWYILLVETTYNQLATL